MDEECAPDRKIVRFVQILRTVQLSFCLAVLFRVQRAGACSLFR